MLLKSSPDQPPPVARGRPSAARTGRRRRATAGDPPQDPETGKPRARAAARSVPPLVLDLAAVTDAQGLKAEVALLRAAIRRLSQDGEDAGQHVRVLAELRHQVEALCTALKTQHALDDEQEGDTLAADLARALEELGDELGVPR